MNVFKSEPAAAVGAIMALVYLAVAFGAPISAEQQKAMQDQLPYILPMLAAGIIAIRQMVWPQKSVEEIAQKNVTAGYAAGENPNVSKPAPTLTT